MVIIFKPCVQRVPVSVFFLYFWGTLDGSKHLKSYYCYYYWLVVSTLLKNISQLGVLFPIYGKIKAMFQTTNQLFIVPDQVPTRMRISVWKHPYREGHGVRKHAIVFHLSNYPVVHPKIAHVQMFILKKKGLQCTLW